MDHAYNLKLIIDAWFVHEGDSLAIHFNEYTSMHVILAITIEEWRRNIINFTDLNSTEFDTWPSYFFVVIELRNDCAYLYMISLTVVDEDLEPCR